MTKTVVGSFDSFEQAQRAVDDLALSGFDRKDISLLASNIRGEYNPDNAAAGTETTTGEAIGVGAVTGGVLGAAPGVAVGMVALAVPGVGPIIAAGSLAAALAGAATGAVAGGIIGGLTRVGIPEEQAHYYAESVRRGGALVTIRVEDREAEGAAQIMRREGAVDIDERAAQWRVSG
jgi:Heat induced stress protein YflT domain